MDAKFILVSIDTTISIKKNKNWLSNGNFSKGYSKWPILAKVQRGDPLQKSQNWPSIQLAMAIVLKGTQNGQFWPKCKGGTLCKNLKIGHFLGPTLKGCKIINTSRILA